MIAAKVKSKYWMYFGYTNIFIASSDDLIHWEVATNEETKRLVTVLHRRLGYFDSQLVEPSPFALQREEGILFIYNRSNAANFNGTTKPKFIYSAEQALYDFNYRYRLVKRTNTSFINPDKPYVKEGELNEVCFVEGLVYFNNPWLLYYAMSDSQIAVAVKEESRPIVS